MMRSGNRVVVTIHGIRTHGKWQKEITPYLARYGLIPHHIDYGFFGALKFLFPPTRERQIEHMRDEVRKLIEHAGCARVNIVAHSFGTYLATEVLLRDNGSLLFDRMVLAGSIVACDFDWPALSAARHVTSVRNERARGDSVVVWAERYSRWFPRLLRNAGASGRVAFSTPSDSLFDYSIDGGHSACHNVTKYEAWARFIAYPLLPEDILERVRNTLQKLRQFAAKAFDRPVDTVRTNLFAMWDGMLRIVPGAVDNMTHEPEFRLRIESGDGCTGTAFKDNQWCVACKIGPHWSNAHLPGDELEKIHPRLRWVVSLPIPSSTHAGKVLAVVNIDGLDNIPAVLQNFTSQECQDLLLALHSSILEPMQTRLEIAFKGDRFIPAGS